MTLISDLSYNSRRCLCWHPKRCPNDTQTGTYSCAVYKKSRNACETTSELKQKYTSLFPGRNPNVSLFKANDVRRSRRHDSNERNIRTTGLLDCNTGCLSILEEPLICNDLGTRAENLDTSSRSLCLVKTLSFEGWSL